MADSALEADVARMIVESLRLEDVDPAGLDRTAPLFGGGLGLDSIDALELGVALQKRYGVKMSADAAENRRHFGSVRSLADFVASQGGTAKG